VGSLDWWIDLFDVTITITLGYNSSHTQLLPDNNPSLCSSARSLKHVDSLLSHFTFIFLLLSYSGLSWYHNYNAGTVTLQISLHYSTHKVFKSHVQSSQVNEHFMAIFHWELRTLPLSLHCSQSHIATDGQSWCQAPSGAHDWIFITLWQLRSCFCGGALSDDRTGLQVKSKSKSPDLVSSPIWGSWPDIYYSLTVTVLLLWGALSHERAGL
jgi:hypothetical protein